MITSVTVFSGCSYELCRAQKTDFCFDPEKKRLFSNPLLGFHFYSHILQVAPSFVTLDRHYHHPVGVNATIMGIL